MKRRTRFFLPLAAAILAAACMETPETPLEDRGLALELAPVTDAATKAPVDGTVFPAARTMKVSAYYNAVRGASANYFSNTTFSKFSGTWKGGTTSSPNPKYWPQRGTLDIFAYSADGLAPAGLSYVPSYKAKVSDGCTVAVDDNSAVQTDILWGAVTGQTRVAEGNPMTMRHAQALLCFTAQSNVAYDATNNRGITIKAVRVEDAYWSGTLEMDATKAAGQNCTWTSLGSRKTKAAGGVSLPTTTAAAVKLPYNVPSSAMSVGAAGCHMGIGGVGLMVPEQAQTQFAIEYTLHNGKDDKGNNVDNQMEYEYTCSGTWEEGLKYVYNIVFTLSEIEVVPSVLDWAGTAVAAPVPSAS